MSDVVNKSDFEKLKRLGSINSLVYIKNQLNADEVVLKISLSCKSLKCWYDLKKLTSLKVSFIEILNAVLKEKLGVQVKKDCSGLEGRIRRLCSQTHSKLKGLSGEAYNKLCNTVREFKVRQGELLSITEVESDLKQLKIENEALKEENISLLSRCESLYTELQNAVAQEKETQKKFQTVSVDFENLKKENSHLHQYLDKIEEQKRFENTGGKIHEVKGRQQRRKLQELKTSVEKSLLFPKTLGLNLDSACFKDDNGENYKLDYSSKENPKSFKDLPDEEQEKVKCVLFLTDKFCISDSAYHELTMTTGGDNLPRSYLIKQCKENLNQLCHITRTLGSADGAQLSFQEELTNRIKLQLNENATPEKVNIKLSGDGAKMTRMTNFVVLSYSLLDTDDMMSSKGNHTVAVIKGHESYDLLKSSGKDVFSYINKLIDDGNICIDGKEIPTNIYLGGDYKFLLLVLGMKGATFDFACLWCLCHKKDRHDMSKPKDFYWEQHISRKIGNFAEWARQTKYSCAHPPLLNIPLENVVADELHLMLRITDNLLSNLVQQAAEWDKTDNHNKPPSLRTDAHLNALVKCINGCGACFSVWEKKNADGKGSGTFDFTSLMGSDKKLLLENLPDKLGGVIKPEGGNTVIKLWKSFGDLYKIVNKDNPSQQEINNYFVKAQEWITTFTSLGSLCQGYQKERVTPYMHIMAYHIPRLMMLHKGIREFSGQGVEKKNDDCRCIHLQKSNKWDASKDVLLVLKRQEHLSNFERPPRQYHKRKAAYWETDINKKRAKQLSHIQSEKTSNLHETQVDVENMTPTDIKEKLKEMGITSARNIKKLQQMFRDAMLACSTTS